MSISDGMMKILNIVAEKTNGNTTNLVHDTKIIEDSHPKDEVYNYLYQLESLNLTTIAMKVGGADFVLISITKEGLEKVLGAL